MQPSITTQTMALAAICQALTLVKAVAKTTDVDQHELDTILSSVAILEAETPEDIYGGSLTTLQTGYKVLLQQLGDNPNKDVEVTRYAVAVLALEKRLSKSGSNMAALGKRLQQLARQLEHFSISDDTMLASLADIYIECISTLGTRIQVAGQPELLKQTHVQHKVRALLLAAVRAAVLWRQAGGSRLHLLFKRKQLVHEAKQTLNRLPDTDT
ncbi:high frequency lysogenization protein HflD [Alkalimonas collagenimarina]|uniref:High frequency lysogenization protein HflD homolog n=1 Tax=Alkalimonas collagenimarina TaxID=400390 RepID=A0ABT9H4H1_9GAMM|nr:high frequency lysogenization protein HflD [Alkalimonas collagenimarina]MDP4537805.1 high frequency lysogenization protein HflD [Alkalimonas collagenimarina]